MEVGEFLEIFGSIKTAIYVSRGRFSDTLLGKFSKSVFLLIFFEKPGVIKAALYMFIGTLKTKNLLKLPT